MDGLILTAGIGVLCVLLAVVAYSLYGVRVFRREILPNPISWALWSIATGAITVLQFSNGGGAVSWASGAMAGACFVIFLLTLRVGVPEVTGQEVITGVAALVAFILWLGIGQPLAAMLLLVTADALATVPTVISACRDPFREPKLEWGMHSLRHALSIFSIADVTVLNLANPIVCAMSNLAVFVVVAVGQNRDIRAVETGANTADEKEPVTDE